MNRELPKYVYCVVYRNEDNKYQTIKVRLFWKKVKALRHADSLNSLFHQDKIYFTERLTINI